MITDSYDVQTQAIISPADMGLVHQQLCDVCIVTFSKVIYEHVLAAFPCEQVAEIGACNGNIPLYTFAHRGHTFGFYLSSIGSALAATDVIEANWLIGATTFVMFGSAGSLDRAATEGKYVIPTKAYRDEGMSYHYAPAADYVEIPNAPAVARLFERRGVP